MENEKIIDVDAQQQEKLPTTTISALSPEALKANLEIETERRKILQTYITDSLVENTDFGKIHVMPKSKCPEPYKCKNSYHFSQPSLFKPGAEKFCSLLQLRAEYAKDADTLSMLGDKTGLIAYKCVLIHIPTGAIVAEGRGACDVQEKDGQVNSAIKIAEKRAKVDAVLSLGLSDTFTQDLEDMDISEILPNKPEIQKTISKPAAIDEAITENQINHLEQLLQTYGMPYSEFVRAYGIINFKQLTKLKALTAIKALTKRIEAGEMWEPKDLPTITVENDTLKNLPPDFGGTGEPIQEIKQEQLTETTPPWDKWKK